ncbi:MAG: winged helix-turn-helix transcriptional regulator, partial [Myxococcales bacterium]|nr:winged helix-turn-helix transcriptional regulator [Myxococcales bacterium]
ERRTAHGVLAAIAAASPRDPVIAFRDEVFHLVESGEPARACARIHVAAAEMVRLGASGEVMRAIESIPLADRSIDARIAHARALARLVEPQRAREELALLDAEADDAAPEPWRYEVRFSLATTSYMVGQVNDGLRQLDELLAAPGLGESLAFQVELQRAWALTTSGRGSEARARLLALGERCDAGDQPALLAFYRAVSAWSDDDEEAMREDLPRALTLVPDQAPPFATGGLVPLSLAVMLARVARFEEAERFIGIAEDGWARSDDLSSQLLLRRMRALTALERGERISALDLLRPVADAYARAGSVVAELGMQAVIGRILLTLGRRAEGHAVLDATEALATRSGAMQAAQAVSRARSVDPLGDHQAAKAPDPRRRGEHVRWRARAALVAAEAGDRAAVRRSLSGLDMNGPGYGVDRAMATIATAALSRLDGDLREASIMLERATREARDDGADDDLVPRLAQRVAVPMLVTGGSRRPSRAPLGPTRVDVVLDGRTHRLTTSGTDVDLAKRPTLRKLLYALARKPGTIFSKQQLSNAIWPARYNPLTHDNALWVNVRRLRVLLADTRLEIASDEQGYRLEAPPDFVFVDPA